MNNKDIRNKLTNIYDDDNIPEVDLPKNTTSNKTKHNVDPHPESSQPSKDAPVEENNS